MAHESEICGFNYNAQAEAAMITESKLTRKTVAVLLMLSLSVVVLQIAGCRPSCSEYAVGVSLRGKLVHSSTLEPVIDARIGVRAFLDGKLVASPSATLATEADGSFLLYIPLAYGGACGFLETLRLDLPEVTHPDQIEVIVFRIGLNECEQRFDIEVATDTVVDEEFSHIIELKNPILVGPCVHSTRPAGVSLRLRS